MNALRILEKMLPFITAATPGGFRIFVLGFSNFFIMQESRVFFSTGYTLAAFFVMLSGIGFATILMKRMAEKESFSVFLRYACSCLVLGGLVGAVVLYITSYIVPVPNFGSLLVVVLSISLYQVLRSYLVFKRDFWLLFFYDVIIAMFFIVMIIVAFKVHGAIDPGMAFNILSVSYLLAFLVCFIFVGRKYVDENKLDGFGFISFPDTVSSFVVGFSNATSSGASFVLPSFFLALGGSDVAIVASLCAAVFNAMAALPRGLINNKASSLSKMVMKRSFSEVTVLQLRSQIKKMIFSLVPILTLCIFVYFYLTGEVDDYWIIFFFVSAFSFNVATGQLGVIESVLVNFCGYEKFSLAFNFVVFIIVLLLFSVVRFLPAAKDFVFLIYAVPFALGVINIIRMLWYRKLVERYFSADNK